MKPYHGRKPRDGRRETGRNESGWTGPQPAATGDKRQRPALDCGVHVGEVIDQVSDAARHQDTADSDGLSAGAVALPKMAGRTNLRALGRAVCSSRVGVNAASVVQDPDDRTGRVGVVAADAAGPDRVAQLSGERLSQIY